MSEKRKVFGFIGILIVAVIMLFSSISVFAKNISLENGNNKQEASEILSEINCYQKNYFKIIKRNNMLLTLESNKTFNKDKKDLDKLYKKVQKQITNKYYLKKYKDIQKRYAKCDEITDPGMKEFFDRNYNEIDDLLNEEYKEIKSKISPEDYKNLTKSETEWIKEVENYDKGFSSMDYGTIGTHIYYNYQINMREFRTLLLMLYL